MRTVKEFILSNELKYAKYRLEKLNELGAPQVMIDNQAKMVAEMESGIIKVGGDQTLLDKTFDKFEVKKGRVGKQYVAFDNGVKYFPEAKYGRFVCCG